MATYDRANYLKVMGGFTFIIDINKIGNLKLPLTADFKVFNSILSFENYVASSYKFTVSLNKYFTMLKKNYERANNITCISVLKFRDYLFL